MTRLYYIDTDIAIEELVIEEPEKYNVIQVVIEDDGSYAIWGNDCWNHGGSSDFLEEGPELAVPETWLKSVAYRIEYDEDDKDVEDDED